MKEANDTEYLLVRGIIDKNIKLTEESCIKVKT